MPSGSKIVRLTSGVAADAPDDVAEEKEVDVAVDEFLAGRRDRHAGGAPDASSAPERSELGSGRSPEVCADAGSDTALPYFPNSG